METLLAAAFCKAIESPRVADRDQKRTISCWVRLQDATAAARGRIEREERELVFVQVERLRSDGEPEVAQVETASD